MDHTTDQLYKALAAYLKERGITATADHTSGGERRLETTNELGLTIHLELYDLTNGNHDLVPLGNAAESIANWRKSEQTA